MVRIVFSRIAGEPCLCAIAIDGKSADGLAVARKVNCGFDTLAGYERGRL